MVLACPTSGGRRAGPSTHTVFRTHHSLGNDFVLVLELYLSSARVAGLLVCTIDCVYCRTMYCAVFLVSVYIEPFHLRKKVALAIFYRIYTTVISKNKHLVNSSADTTHEHHLSHTATRGPQSSVPRPNFCHSNFGSPSSPSQPFYNCCWPHKRLKRYLDDTVI